jgi:hypothetical protein
MLLTRRKLLNLSPPATLRWSHDVFGNSIAIASFAEPSAEVHVYVDWWRARSRSG